MKSKNKRVLAFSDEHLPAAIPGRVKFLKGIYDQWECDTIILLGDFIDLHAISSHTTEADAKGALGEMQEAVVMAQEYYKTFPKLTMIMGNHDLRIIRAANEAKLPKNWLRPFESVIGAPKGWNIRYKPLIIDGVFYDHGEGCAGINGHKNKAIKEGMPCVIGHLHSHAGIAFTANSHSLPWGMNIGCGIDQNTYHMRYGKKFVHKPIVGCGVIIDGHPYFEAMDLGSKVNLKL